MKTLGFFEWLVELCIVAVIVFSVLASVVDCIAPLPKSAQMEQMEPTLEMYRAFDLAPSRTEKEMARDALKRHVEETERDMMAYFSARARGKQ